MNSVKLIALDIDGTLYNKDGVITSYNKEMIRKAVENGITVIISTGRPYIGLPVDEMKELGIQYAITANGSAVYRVPEKELLLDESMDTDLSVRLLRKLYTQYLHIDAFINGDGYTQFSTSELTNLLDIPDSLKKYIQTTRKTITDLAAYIEEHKLCVSKLTLNFAPVELILTDFKLLYESVKAGMKGSLLQTNINDTRKIDLKYNQNSFSISFSAINFAVPHRIRYEYRLENHNEEWEHSNSVRNVSYMNLSSGKYVFRLRAFDKYTGQQVGERSLDIVIHNPYWVSWWALLLYFILLSVFVYMFVQYRRHKVNEGRIRDKIRSFISIAHDIRTPVTLIKAPLSELEAQEGLPEQGKKTVAVAMKNVEKLMGMITQLLELQKTELHAEECLKVSPYDIKAYLEEKMAEFHLAAMQKSVG